jgi:sodium-dependent dicarboxylate transporter 2/3/5
MPIRYLPSRNTVQWTGFVGGPVLAFVAYALLPHSYRDGAGALVEFTHAGRVTCAAGLWMAVWWMTEALPIYVTALLPLCLFPLFGAVSVHDAAAPYANELIFLFMGGFVVALSMEKWGLHRRIAFGSLRIVGSDPHRVVLGFMMATAFISMWVSNTATAIMMLPIALSVIDVVLRQTGRGTLEETGEIGDGPAGNFAVCLMLGIAYSASIGGIGTLIGTPPNLFLASYIKTQLGREVSFVRWLAVGVPLVVVFLPIAWLLLTRVLYPIRLKEIEGGASFIRDQQRQLGPMNRGERTTLVVFALAALCWIFRPLLAKVALGGAAPFKGLSDTGIAMIAAMALFAIPQDIKERKFVMDWHAAAKIPWGVLLLFGGGLSLAASIEKTGVGEFIGSRVAGMAGFPGVAMVVIVTAIVIYLTELTSNTATTATFVPILAAVAPALGVSPYMLIVPAAIAASCAFMLPAGTPPNALVFGSGHIRIAQMIRAGFWLNLIGIILITALCYALVIPLFVR